MEALLTHLSKSFGSANILTYQNYQFIFIHGYLEIEEYEAIRQRMIRALLDAGYSWTPLKDEDGAGIMFTRDV